MQQTTTMRSIMSDFADSTGLTNDSPGPRRYLWTDAFAVCNYLELYCQTGDMEDLQLAKGASLPSQLLASSRS